jgi:hypothetical protein
MDVRLTYVFTARLAIASYGDSVKKLPSLP